MATMIDRYKVEKDDAVPLCPWTLFRDSRPIAHLTTEERATEYRDYLIEKESDDDD